MILFLAAICLVCLGYACFVPSTGIPDMLDHYIFISTTKLMRSGSSYYPAMDKSLREVYGPAQSVRAFRLPTLFLFWSRLPSPRWIWAAYVALVAVTGLLLLRLTEVPVLALVAVIYLLNNAIMRTAGGWLAQFTATELWAVPFVAATLLAWRYGRDQVAAALALMAALVRETTAGLLVGGLAAAYLDRRPVWPWLIATGVAGVAFAAHIACASVHLVPLGEGRETPLLGTGGPLALVRMAGFSLPAGYVVGPVLWLLALRTAVLRRGRWERPAAAYLALPLAGLLVDRPYWGILIVPFTIILGGNAIESLLAMRRGRREAPSHP